MAFLKIPYNPKYGRPPRGVEIGGKKTIDKKPAVILESKAKNNQRRNDRAAAGLTNDFKLVRNSEANVPGAVGDTTSYRGFLESAGLDESILDKDGFEL